MTEVRTGNSIGRTLWFRVFVLALIAIALCLALLALLDRAGDLNYAPLLGNSWLGAALVIQISGLSLFVIAWHLILRIDRSVSIGLVESAAQIGITLVGKYLPGKVWGLLGRTYYLKRRGMSVDNATRLLLLDQFLTFFGGLLIGLSALIGSLNVSAGGLFLLLGLLASPLILRSNYSMIDWVTDNAGRWFARFKTRSASHSLTIVPRSLYLPFLAYLAHWLVISLVLCLIFLPLLGDQVFSNSLLIVAAIPLGVLTGFLALWAPGGIGVREAVIIGVLALNMDIEVASSIAITYRLICVVNDSVMGLVAFVFYGRGLATT